MSNEESILAEIREVRTAVSALRESMSEIARGLHSHIDKATIDLAPKDVVWWVLPAKVVIYGGIIFFFLWAGTMGLIDLGVLENWRDWATTEAR